MSARLEKYKGLEIVTPVPVGRGGRALNDNARIVADRMLYVSSSSPSITDDSSSGKVSGGFVVGSRWFDTSAGKEYVCIDSTVGAANWVAAGSGGISLNDLTNISLTGLSDEDTLVYNSSTGEWEPQPYRPNLSDLDDVSILSPPDANNVLKFNVATNKWVAGTINVANLGDIATTAPENGQVLAYNSSTQKWGPQSNTAASLAGLSDVNVSTKAENHALVYNASTQQWKNKLLSLINLSGVNSAMTPVEGHYLKYTGGQWSSSAFPTVPTDLNSLSDVNIDGAIDGQFLMRSGGSWIDQTLLLSNISNIDLSGLLDGYILRYNASNSKWEAEELPASGAVNLEDLANVVTTGIGDGYVLQYNLGSGDWVAEALPEPASVALGDITDIDLTGLQDDWILKYDQASLSWKAQALSGTVPTAIGDLSDVTLVGLQDDWILRYDQATLSWKAEALSGSVPTMLDGLSDVDADSPSDGDVLFRSGSNWIDHHLVLNDIANVVINTPQDNEFLRFNGINWVNEAVNVSSTLGGLSNVADTVDSGPQANQFLRYVGGTWTNTTVTIPSVIGDLSNVTVTTPQHNELLKYTTANGGKWVNGTMDLDLLSDVVIGGVALADDQFLRYNGSSWVNEAVTIPTNLNSLTDVTITGTASHQQFLRYSTTSNQWVNESVSMATDLNGLSDVVIGGAALADDQFLRYNGSSWVNEAVAIPTNLNSLTDVTITGTASHQQFLRYSTVSNQWVNETVAIGGGATVVADEHTLTLSGGTTMSFKTDMRGSSSFEHGTLTSAIGNFSFAQGKECLGGSNSTEVSTFAQGSLCTASSRMSFAQGVECKNTGSVSFSQGSKCSAIGSASFAQGMECTSGSSSAGKGIFAQGSNCKSFGSAGFAQGLQCTTDGNVGFAQGLTCTGSDGGFAQGKSCTSSGYAIAQGTLTIATGTLGGGFAQGISCTAIGEYGSFAQGLECKALRNSCMAVGAQSIAYGCASFAQGYQDPALGGGWAGALANASFAQGMNCLAGQGTVLYIPEEGLIATGADGNTGIDSPGWGIFAQGWGCTARGAAGSFAVGINCTSTIGAGSFAFGTGCISSATNAFAIGRGCTVGTSGLNSFAFGDGCKINGARSFAMGLQSIAGTSSSESFLFGHKNTSNAGHCFAMGAYATTNASNTFAFGNHATVQSYGGLAMGSNALVNTSSTFGFAFGTSASASGPGAVQFGSGNNLLNNSLRVGTSPRLVSGGSRSGFLNGDIWLSGGNVIIESGGASHNITTMGGWDSGLTSAFTSPAGLETWRVSVNDFMSGANAAPDPNASMIPVNSDNFDGILAGSGPSVQDVIDTLDDHTHAGFVTYSGASGDVDLGLHGLTLNDLTIGALSGVLKATAGVVSGSATTDDLSQGLTNKYFSNTLARGAISTDALGLSYNSATGQLSLDAGFTIPLTTEIGLEEATDPSNEAGFGKLYCKESGGRTELFFMDDDGNIIQLTSAGALNTMKYAFMSTTGAAGQIDLTGVNWATNKALIKTIKIDTTSTNWDVSLYPDSDFDTAGVSPPLSIGSNESGNKTFLLDLPYDDTNSTNAVHIKFTDNSGASATANIFIWGVKLS